MNLRNGLLAITSILVCAAASAQEYGQWWWEANIGGAARSYRNSLDGASMTDYEERELHVFVGINGYVIHPAIAAFSAGIDTSASRYPSKSSLPLNRRGYRVNLSILPESLFPLQVYANRQDYSLASQPEPDEPLPFAIPERGTSYGGRFRLRGGPLRGLEAAADRTTYDVIGLQPGREMSNRDVLDFTRGSKIIQQHYRVERQVRDYGVSQYRLSDLIGRAEEQGVVGIWNWSLYGNLLRRQFSMPSLASPTLTAGHVQSLFTTGDRDRAAWSFLGQSDYSEGSGDRLATHRVEARYLPLRWDGLQWYPYASYALQTSKALRIQAPSAGVAANWTRTAGAFNGRLSSSVGVLELISSGPDAPPAVTRLSYSGGFSIAHAAGERLREQLEAQQSRNELRTTATLEGQPGFGIVGFGGTEDTRQARFTVSGRISNLATTLYSDWMTRDATPEALARFHASTLTNALQIASRTVTVTAMSGNGEVATDRSQKIRFVSAGMSLRPFSWLSLNGNYRRDHRDAIFEPRIQGQRLEGGASIRIGAIYIVPQAFRMTETMETGSERKINGFTVVVSRQLGGLLPIVSAPKRRGTIQ